MVPERFGDGYVVRAPELIAEVAYSSASRDLHQKKAAYERNGVREYIVWRKREDIVDWFALREGRYEAVAGRDGIVESEEFPGLRLDIGALIAGDRRRILEAVRPAR